MKDRKVGVIVQARMGSTRLPGKVLKQLNENETVLSLLIKRLKMSKNLNSIIIATTPDDRNKSIIEVSKSLDVNTFIGDELHVLKRYFEAASEFKLDIIIRITSDCPFIDPNELDDMIDFYLKENYDYIRNVDESTNFPRGFEVEIFSYKHLEKAYMSAKTKSEREHVTYYFYTHPEFFTVFSYNLQNLKKIEELRLTIDEEADLEACQEVFQKLIENGKGINFSVYDVIDIIEMYPEIMDINRNVQQKKV